MQSFFIRVPVVAMLVAALSGCGWIGTPSVMSKNVSVTNDSYIPTRVVGKDGTAPDGSKDAASLRKGIANDSAVQQLLGVINEGHILAPQAELDRARHRQGGAEPNAVEHPRPAPRTPVTAQALAAPAPPMSTAPRPPVVAPPKAMHHLGSYDPTTDTSTAGVHH